MISYTPGSGWGNQELLGLTGSIVRVFLESGNFSVITEGPGAEGYLNFGSVKYVPGQGWLDASRRLYRDAGRLAAEALGVPEAQGGTFLFFDVQQYLAEGECGLDFLKRCLDMGVLLTPGLACGGAYERWARLCFTSVPPEQLATAISSLGPVLQPQERASV